MLRHKQTVYWENGKNQEIKLRSPAVNTKELSAHNYKKMLLFAYKKQEIRNDYYYNPMKK